MSGLFSFSRESKKRGRGVNLTCWAACARGSKGGYLQAAAYEVCSLLLTPPLVFRVTIQRPLLSRLSEACQPHEEEKLHASEAMQASSF